MTYLTMYTQPYPFDHNGQYNVIEIMVYKKKDPKKTNDNQLKNIVWGIATQSFFPKKSEKR